MMWVVVPRILVLQISVSVPALDVLAWSSICLLAHANLTSIRISILHTGISTDRDIVHTGILFSCLRERSYFLSFVVAPVFMHQESLFERYIHHVPKGILYGRNTEREVEI